MTEPFWISKSEVLFIHDQQIAQQGGPPGLRDDTLLESALARPHNLLAYGDPDLVQLAAAYAWGLARNHAFVDGNKRTSFLVCLTFLALNGLIVTADEDSKIRTWLALAEGSLDETGLAAWLRTHVTRGS